MSKPRRLEAGPPAQKPPPRIQKRSRWICVVLALTAFGLEGCQSLRNRLGSGCGGCGGLFSRFNNRSVEYYEPPIIEDPVEVVPGEIVTEPAPSTTIIPVPSSPSPPLEPPSDLELDPLPEPTGAAKPKPGSTPSGDKTVHSQGRGQSAASYGRSSTAITSKPKYPTSNGTASSNPSQGSSTPPMSLQVLEDLPAPADEMAPAVARTDAVPALTGRSGEMNVETPPVTPEPDPASIPITATPPADESPPVSLPEIPSTPSISLDAAAWAAPGIRSFSPVDPQLAGGSFPEESGWEFLAQKGYRTVLDLRDPSEIQPQQIAAIHHWGLRHVMLPVRIDQLNADLFRRFEAELNQSEARPLYFCDTDGSRSSILWYIHRINLDKVDPAMARRDAEQIGPLSPEALAAAQTLLNPPEATAAPVTPPTEEAAPPPPVTEAPPAEDSTVTAAAEQANQEIPAELMNDPTAWRPYAALFLSVLVVPLAYWSGASIGLTRRRLARASLGVSARKLRSLPGASDAGT